MENEIAQSSSTALRALTHSDSHFSGRQLVQALAEEAQGRGINADTVIALQQQLLASTQVVALQVRYGEARWTTPEMLALEKNALHTADELHERERQFADSRIIVEEVIRKHSQLSGEQRLALHHVTGSEGGIRVVTGMAGTGKSSLFKAAQEVWMGQQRKVHGACLAGKAAQELTQASGVPAQTLHRLLWELEHGKLQLNAQSVLLIDEAGMVGTRQMSAVLDCSLKSGASLVLCGDAGQLQSIEAGGVFRELSERFGSASLKEIRRQRDVWAREAVRAFAEGRTAEALGEFDARGLLSYNEDAHVVMDQLFRDWQAQTLKTPDQAIIIAARNVDVIAFNEMAQRARFHAGQLQGNPIHAGRSSFFTGDRILFTKNSAQLKVCNGQMATIADAQGHSITAQLDTGKTVTFSAVEYPHLQLAYALTTHKAQGLTVERSFVYLDPATQSRETSYVQSSRARGQCSLYAVAESVEELVPAMARSHPKLMATSLLNAQPAGPVLKLELAY